MDSWELFVSVQSLSTVPVPLRYFLIAWLQRRTIYTVGSKRIAPRPFILAPRATPPENEARRFG